MVPAHLKTCFAFICLLFSAAVTNLQAEDAELVRYFDPDTYQYAYGLLYWIVPNKISRFVDHTKKERIVSRHCDFNDIGYRLWFNQTDADVSHLPMHVFRVPPPPATSLPPPDFSEPQNCEAGTMAVE